MINETKLKQINNFLEVLTEMLFEDQDNLGWSGANQEVCCRWLKKIGYLKVVNNEYVINKNFSLLAEKVNKDYVWKDTRGQLYTLGNLTDKYLLNILNFIARGGGSVEFLDYEKITRLYNESQKRNLHCDYSLRLIIDRFNDKLSCACNEHDPF